MTKFPIVNMLMCEKELRLKDFANRLGFSSCYISRTLNEIYPLQYHIKKAVYELLGPMPITMDQLFTPRGDSDIYRMLELFAAYKKDQKLMKWYISEPAEKGEEHGKGGE